MSTLLWPEWTTARRKSVANTAVDVVVEIGIHHARFACVERRRLGRQRVLVCDHFPSFAAALLAYCRIYGIQPRHAVVAVAAPVLADFIALPHAPWSFCVSQTRELLALEQLLVLNDFEALALAIPQLTRRQLLQIGGQPATAGAVKAVIGPGEGLGMASVLPTATDWLVMATEGGHATFAPNSELEFEVSLALREQTNGHLSLEQVLSTAGLVGLYQVLSKRDGIRAASLNAFQICRKAQAGDQHCQQALDLFCRILGNAAGNLALTVGARGGVYIAGPIVPRLRDYFLQSSFRSAFENKGRFREYLAAIPVWVINESRPSLLGAATRLSTLNSLASPQQDCCA